MHLESVTIHFNSIDSCNCFCRNMFINQLFLNDEISDNMNDLYGVILYSLSSKEVE